MRQEAEKRCELLFVWITARSCLYLRHPGGTLLAGKFEAYSELPAFYLPDCMPIDVSVSPSISG